MIVKTIPKQTPNGTQHYCADCPDNGTGMCFVVHDGNLILGRCRSFTMTPTFTCTQLIPWCNYYVANEPVGRKTIPCPGGCGRELFRNELKGESLCNACLDHEMSKPLASEHIT